MCDRQDAPSDIPCILCMRTILVVRKDVSVLSSAEHAGPIFGRVMSKTENVSRSEATNYQQQQRQCAVRTDMQR